MSKKEQVTITQVQPTQSVSAVTISKTPEPTESEKIWNEVKGLKLNMFSIPGQTVSQYCDYQPIGTDRCYVTARVTSTLPALESLLAKKYKVEMLDKYYVISRK